MISKSTCDRLGIQDWKKLFFWLRMTDTRSIRLLDLIRKLEIVVGSYAFEISAIVLPLDAPGAYPLLLGWPWLRAANIKQNWQHNNISFCCDRAKISGHPRNYANNERADSTIRGRYRHVQGAQRRGSGAVSGGQPVGSGQGRLCGRDHTTICFGGRTCVWEI